MLTVQVFVLNEKAVTDRPGQRIAVACITLCSGWISAYSVLIKLKVQSEDSAEQTPPLGVLQLKV